MFLVNEKAFPYRDPWIIPIEERLRSLCKGSRRVAYFYERPDTSTFRYRVYNMIQVLKALGNDIGAAFFGNDDKEELDSVVELADVIVICRARYNAHINQMITRAKAKGKRVLFDVDDLIFNTSYVHLILNTLAQDLQAPEAWDHWFGMIGRIGATLKMCDGAITTNAYLAERIEEYSGLPAAVVPNFLNREQLLISDRIYREKCGSGFARHSGIHIGYFSGTPTHNNDFAVASRALSRVMEADERIKLSVVGFLDPKAGLNKFSDRINHYPLQDFINLQRLMSQVEINIVPLQDNGFTNSKSELKYFEAAAAGTLTIATPIFSYANAIEDGVNGFLATSTEWETKILEVVDRLNSYEELAHSAHEHSVTNYGWFNQLDCIESAVFGRAWQSSF